MTFIAKYVATGNVSSIVFNSIPNTYDDLYLVISAKTNTGGQYVSNALQFNGSYTAYQRRVYEEGTSSVGSDASTNSNSIFFGILPSTGSAQNNDLFNSQTIYIPSYKSSNSAKNAWSNGGFTSNSGAQQYNFNIYAVLTTVTQTGITAITLAPWDVSSYVQYSSAYLYGIKNS